MAEDARVKLELRFVPTDGQPPNAPLFDDLIRLIRQGIVTVPIGVPQVNVSGEYLPPTDKSQAKLETGIKHRIEQTSADSWMVFEKRKEIAAQPDGEAKLAAESLEAAQQVVSAVQRAIIRGIVVQIPEDNQHSNDS
jgi:hypothetical protein